MAILSIKSDLEDHSPVVKLNVFLFFLHKSEKRVAERNKRLDLLNLLINWGNQFLIPPNGIIENDLCQIPRSWTFCQMERVLIIFWKPKILPKLSKIIVTFPKSINTNVLACPKLAKWLSILNCWKSAKWPIWKSIYFQSWWS